MRIQKNLTLLLISVMMLAVGCGVFKHKPHPNAIDAFDANAYDSLTAAQGSLDEAKAEFAAGKLPAEAKEVINATGQAYNAARATWLTYRDVAAGLKQGDLTQLRPQLQSDLQALANAVGALKKLIGGK